MIMAFPVRDTVSAWNLLAAVISTYGSVGVRELRRILTPPLLLGLGLIPYVFSSHDTSRTISSPANLIQFLLTEIVQQLLESPESLCGISHSFLIVIICGCFCSHAGLLSDFRKVISEVYEFVPRDFG